MRGLRASARDPHQDIERLFPAIEGEDPRAVTALYDRMLAQVFKAGHAGATFGGIGTIDMAIWDLKAKMAGEPLWRLLGARDRFVTGYASGLDIALDDEQLAEWYRGMADRGFTSGKLKGGRDLDDDIRRLGIIADSLAANTARPAVMLDANESWNLKQAVRYITAIEKEHDLTWIEEPLRRWDADGHARLSSAIKAAVATGENLTGLEQFTPLLDSHGPSTSCRPDASGESRTSCASHMPRTLGTSRSARSGSRRTPPLRTRPHLCPTTFPPRCKTSARPSA